MFLPFTKGNMLIFRLQLKEGSKKITIVRQRFVHWFNWSLWFVM